MNLNGVMLRIRGKVQGVGFRPFVWQLAQQLKLTGDVCNDGAGVLVRLTSAADAFMTQLHAHCPPLARIDSVEQSTMQWETLPQDFTIRHSDSSSMDTQIVPDAATCPDCLRELNDPNDRRYRYPFINCTHCGPRFTIINAMPYDRPNTVMAAFPLCPACEKEYRNPMDRRFHAQPVACPDCGPHMAWQCGEVSLEREDALQAAVMALKAGKIVAIKGLGGFHLAVDARNNNAVANLRDRKHRPTKPLAVMLPDSDGLPADVVAQLNTPAAPIVLMAKSDLPDLSEFIALHLNEVGVMLPANPLQHLLMQGFGAPLVMTSGNVNAKPPAITNQQAREELSNIADGWLLHNRDIVQRMDDSVVRANGEMLRRARGFVPDALPLPPGFAALPPILALGADLKNTFCLLRDNQAVLSQHLGDLSEDGVEQQWHKACTLMCEAYDFTPEHVVIDAHPGYHSARIGREMGLPISTVLHHHAHAVACMAEHFWPRDGRDVIALTLDGIGYGENDQLWGGECLRVNYQECEHLGGLPAVSLPGGDLAARQPWRNLLAHCLTFLPDWQQYPETAIVREQNWPLLATAIARGINTPLASSAGRLFDAAAAALNCAPLQQSYEGEAACRFEALASLSGACLHPVTLPLVEGKLDMATFWQQWMNWHDCAPARAWAFHDALAKGFADLARSHARRLSINTLVFSGGVLHNTLMRERFAHHLADFNLLFPTLLPAGDGALALGQALVAAARLSLPSQG
ncbi:carbamoyltransferase HypF [Buttiauxella sp. A111]|nr:carbamoyltransferase HypF [Buttiauxella sp. A111]